MLGKSDAKEVPNPQQELRNRRNRNNRNNSRTCSDLHLARTKRTSASWRNCANAFASFKSYWALVNVGANFSWEMWLHKTILDQEKRRTRTRSRRFNGEDRILGWHAWWAPGLCLGYPNNGLRRQQLKLVYTNPTDPWIYKETVSKWSRNGEL